MSATTRYLLSESLVGIPGRKIYNASGSTEASFDISMNGRLVAKGFRLGKINTLGPSGPSICISSKSLSMGGWSVLAGPETPSIVPDKLWRTLVADRGPDGTTPPSWYHRACLYLLTKCIGPGGDIDVSYLMLNILPSTVIEFLKRAESVLWERQFFLTGASKYFGLVPTNAQIGDVICILFGCSVPVVLREHTNKRIRDGSETAPGCGNYYELIGECYVHGVMDGQAVEAREGNLPDEEFAMR